MPGGVGAHGAVDELLEPGELDDLVEAATDLLLGEPEDDAVDVDVLASAELGMEPGAQLDEGGHAALRRDATDVGPVDPGDDPDQRALAGPVPADDPQGRAPRDGEADVAQRLDVLGGPGRRR